MSAAPAPWHRLFRRVPFSAEILLLAYNLVGLPLLLWRGRRQRSEMLYERYSLYNFAGILAARLLRVPLVLEVNAPLAAEQSLDGQVRAAWLAHRVERWIINAADHAIVVSGALRQHLLREGVRSDHLVVQPNGVNLESMAPRNGASLRRALGIEGKFVIGYIGWFRSWHAVELLVEAVARLELSGRNACLVLIGDGPGRALVEKDIASRQLGSVARLYGPLDRSEVPAYLSLLDVAVLPAANHYCCPLKLLEYMAMGCAVVAPDQPNVRELVSEETGATFFRPGCVSDLTRALSSCLMDPGRVKWRGALGRQALEDGSHTWLRNAQETLSLVSRDPASVSARRPFGISEHAVPISMGHETPTRERATGQSSSPYAAEVVP